MIKALKEGRRSKNQVFCASDIPKAFELIMKAREVDVKTFAPQLKAIDEDNVQVCLPDVKLLSVTLRITLGSHTIPNFMGV